MLGRPASCAPVWQNVIAGSWLIASVWTDLMKHSSSTTLAVCGSSELTHAHLRRLRPYGPARNLALVAAAALWNVIHLPATLASLLRERRYRAEGWSPTANDTASSVPLGAHR